MWANGSYWTSAQQDAIHDMETDFCLLEHEDVSALLKPRGRFAIRGILAVHC